MNNVIYFDAPTWYCARQCQESINHLTNLRDPKYDIEIRAEKEMLRGYKNDILSGKCAA